MPKQICHDCNQEMEVAQEVKVLGLDGNKKKMSIIKFLVCWKCKRSRTDKS